MPVLPESCYLASMCRQSAPVPQCSFGLFQDPWQEESASAEWTLPPLRWWGGTIVMLVVQRRIARQVSPCKQVTVVDNLLCSRAAQYRGRRSSSCASYVYYISSAPPPPAGAAANLNCFMVKARCGEGVARRGSQAPHSRPPLSRLHPPRLYLPLLHHSLSLPRPLLLLLLARLSL